MIKPCKTESNLLGARVRNILNNKLYLLCPLLVKYLKYFRP